MFNPDPTTLNKTSPNSRLVNKTSALSEMVVDPFCVMPKVIAVLEAAEQVEIGWRNQWWAAGDWAALRKARHELILAIEQTRRELEK